MPLNGAGMPLDGGDDELREGERCRGAPQLRMSARAFASKVLKLDCWPKMLEIFDAIDSGKRRILIRSCNGAGKTTALAALCIWKLAQYPDTIVLTTASSWTQVSKALWGEIRKQAFRAGLFQDANGKSLIRRTEIRLDDTWYALGISPSVAENAMGFHAEHMLIAVDEATGLDPEIFDALLGNATSSDTQMVMICNPIDPDSVPYTAEMSGDWHVISISAMEHPNVETGENIIRGAVTRDWIMQQLCAWSHPVEAESAGSLWIPWADTWWRKTPLVKARILGEWADLDSEGFFLYETLNESLETTASGTLRSIGVDVGRGVDPTVFSYFVGTEQVALEKHYENTYQIAERLASLHKQGWTLLTVDDTGIGGGVCDALHEMGVKHYAVNFGDAPIRCLRNPKPLLNARAEMYFNLEEELRFHEIRLLNDPELFQELSATRIHMNDNVVRYQLEKKDVIRKRLGRSPDKADATALARYGVQLLRQVGVFGFF